MDDAIAQVMRRMCAYFGADVRRINHALKVHAFGACIAANEGLAPQARRGLAVAALLHDIGIKECERKYRSTAGSYQELEGPPVAQTLLAELLAGQELQRVLFLIGHHHSYGKIDGADFQILVEADFLVNCYEDAMTPDQIEPVARKYFRTAAGRALLAGMYLPDSAAGQG